MFVTRGGNAELSLGFKRSAQRKQVGNDHLRVGHSFLGVGTRWRNDLNGVE